MPHSHGDSKGKRKTLSSNDDILDSEPSSSHTPHSESPQTLERRPFADIAINSASSSHPSHSDLTEATGREIQIVSDERFTDIMNYHVTHIHFIAMPNLEDQGDDKTSSNHWKLLLQPGPDPERPDEDQPKFRVLVLEVPRNEYGIGMLTLSSKTKYNPAHWVHTVTCVPLRPVTVATIAATIINVFYSAYLYPKDGEGTRFWHWVVAELFANKRLISMEAMREVHEAVERYWKSPMGSGSEPQEITQGAFTNEEAFGIHRGSIKFDVVEDLT